MALPQQQPTSQPTALPQQQPTPQPAQAPFQEKQAKVHFAEVETTGEITSAMDVSAVCQVLETLGLSRLIVQFRCNGIDGQIFHSLDKHDFQELGASEDEVERLISMVQPMAQRDKQADDDELSVGGDRDDSDADAEASAEQHTQSEAEEVAFLRKVRAVRRKNPRAILAGPGGQRTRFGPADGGDDGVRMQMSMMDIIRAKTERFAVETTWEEYHSIEDIASLDPEKKGQVVSRPFIQRMAYKALCAWQNIRRKLADGNLKKLIEVLPDTDDVGTPIDPWTFRNRWKSNAEELLKHLWKSTEGEVAELRGVWSPCYGARPREGAFFQQQFALDEQQWASKGQGKSADGDYSNRAISFRRCDYGQRGHTYAFRLAMAISFPVLMESLGEEHTAAELWALYKSLHLLAVRRQHSWGSELLRAAAKYRYKTYGAYGHRR